MNDILAPALFEPHVGRTAIATEPSKGPVARRRAVTVGGGHGQAAMLEALLELDCDVTAVVSVADDGGCSGRLRRVSGMPPPGDLRRCLSTLAADRELAARFETRLEGADELRRSVGNLILYEAYLDLGSLSAAVRWAQGCLACRGRVLPVADVAGKLTVYDRGRGVIAGESTIERVGDHPMVASVHGPQRCVPEALEAIREADVVVLGPGSFVTSTLAAVMTGDLAEAIATTSATRLMVQNLATEGWERGPAWTIEQRRLLRDHLCIGSGVDDFEMLVLEHGSTHERRAAEPRTTVVTSPLVDPARPDHHDSVCVAAALERHLGIRRRARRDDRPAAVPAHLLDELERYVDLALDRLARGELTPGHGCARTLQRRPA